MSNWFTRMFSDDQNTNDTTPVELQELNILAANGIDATCYEDQLRERLEAQGYEVEYQCWDNTYAIKKQEGN